MLFHHFSSLSQTLRASSPILTSIMPIPCCWTTCRVFIRMRMNTASSSTSIQWVHTEWSMVLSGAVNHSWAEPTPRDVLTGRRAYTRVNAATHDENTCLMIHTHRIFTVSETRKVIRWHQIALVGLLSASLRPRVTVSSRCGLITYQGPAHFVLCVMVRCEILSFWDIGRKNLRSPVGGGLHPVNTCMRCF